MTSEVQVLLFNMEAGSSTALRSAIETLPEARVVMEVSDRASLAEALRRMTVSVLIAHLDPHPAPVIEIIEATATHFPRVPIIAISEEMDPPTIINAMRAGCQQFVGKPIDRGDLLRAVSRVVVKRPPLAPAGHRICVIGASGGVGATTIACNLAMELAQLTERPSAIVDLQLEFGDVATSFDCSPVHTLASLCQAEGEVDRTLLENAVMLLPCHVGVLARPETVEQAAYVTPERVSSILQQLWQFYQNVVVDTPRTFDQLALSALEQADSVVIVLQLIVPSVRNAMRLYDALINYGVSDDRVRVVVNRYRKNVGRLAPEDVEKHFRKKLFGVVPNDYQCVTNSLDFGHPLMADAPGSAVRTAIREMATQLLALNADPNAPAPPPVNGNGKATPGGARKSGILGRIFRS